MMFQLYDDKFKWSNYILISILREIYLIIYKSFWNVVT